MLANHTSLTACAIGIFFVVQGGLAIINCKCTKQKNILKIMLKNFLDTISGIVGMWSVGNAAGIFDNTSAFFVSSVPLASAATALTAATTAVAIKKRVKSSYAFLCYFMVIPFICSVASGNDLFSFWSSSEFLTSYNFSLVGGFVYPVVVHSIWSSSGFLTAFGPGHGLTSAPGPLTGNGDPIYSLWSSSEGLIAAPAPTFLEFLDSINESDISDKLCTKKSKTLFIPNGINEDIPGEDNESIITTLADPNWLPKCETIFLTDNVNGSVITIDKRSNSGCSDCDRSQNSDSKSSKEPAQKRVRQKNVQDISDNID